MIWQAGMYALRRAICYRHGASLVVLVITIRRPAHLDDLMFLKRSSPRLILACPESSTPGG